MEIEETLTWYVSVEKRSVWNLTVEAPSKEEAGEKALKEAGVYINEPDYTDWGVVSVDEVARYVE